MTITSSGALSLSAIQTEFGGTNPISMSEYYAGGLMVPSGTVGVNGAIPSAGTNSMSKFYGTAAVALSKLYAWGVNTSGQMGLGAPLTNKTVPTLLGSAVNWSGLPRGNATHTMAVRDDGTLWAIGGTNSYGQLGLGDIVARSTPVQVGSLTDWKSVVVGGSATYAIKTDGTLWAWGIGLYGNLGDGTRVSKSSPIQIGNLTNWAQIDNSTQYTTAAIKTDGTLWTWGTNSSGECGYGTTTSYSSPVQVGALTDWKQVSTGASFNMAVKTDGTLWAIGGVNTSGCLGLLLATTIKKSSPTQVGSFTDWSSVSAIGAACGAIRIGMLYTWGANTSYQQGSGNAVSRSSPVQVGTDSDWATINMSQTNGSGLKTNGTLWTWGAFTGMGTGVTSGFYSVPGQVGSAVWTQLGCSGSTIFGISA